MVIKIMERIKWLILLFQRENQLNYDLFRRWINTIVVCDRDIVYLFNDMNNMVFDHDLYEYLILNKWYGKKRSKYLV